MTKPTHLASWEAFWAMLADPDADVLWDVDPAQAAELDWARFKDVIDQQLPLIDLGCGSGTQTRFFAQHLPRVIGVDISPTVIDFARQADSAGAAEYRVFDLLDPAAGAALHAELGPVNVYIRGVLMLFAPDERATAAANLRALIGARGVCYLNEYPPQAKAYYTQIFSQQGMAPAFAKVLEAGITPGGLTAADLEALFPAAEYEQLLYGQHLMHTTIALQDGNFAAAPALYCAVRHRASAD